MGYYINCNTKGEPLPAIGKAEKLIEDGALPIPIPNEFKEGLVCVVSNGQFDAAGYAYNEEEMEVFKNPNGRPTQWLYFPPAAELSGFKK